MQLYFVDIIAFATALFCIRSWLTRRMRMSHNGPHPPGPKGLPIIGNVLDIGGGDEWETARLWSEEYGPLVYVKTFGTPYLFLNSYQAAVDLLEKRGDIYSTRPRTAMLELEGWSDWFASVLPYGDELRKIRQIMHRFFQRPATKDYYEEQERATHELLFKLLETPDEYRAHIRHCAAEAIIKVTYGYEVIENDPYVELVEKGVDSVAEAVLSFVINTIPILRYLPTWILGPETHRKVQEGQRLSKAMYSEPFAKAKRLIVDGTASPSITSRLLDGDTKIDGNVLDESIIAKVVGVSYAAGGDTIVSAILTFFLAMVLYPDTMAKGQKELDEVIGSGNLPTFEDRPKLPYINAICEECLRWQTVTPLGVPHCVEKDDLYNGYFIPAGTVILANAWAMLRDPHEYPEPEKFIPERWLTSDPPIHSNRMAFGFGRRLCPGRHFAENAIFIVAASVLAVFHIQKAVDPNGVPITPAEEYTSTSSVRHPKPFKCKITPRSNDATALIRATMASMK